VRDDTLGGPMFGHARSEMREQKPLSECCQNVSIFFCSFWRPEKPFVLVDQPWVHHDHAIPSLGMPPENIYSLIIEPFAFVLLSARFNHRLLP
jgi:hypothetical protein